MKAIPTAALAFLLATIGLAGLTGLALTAVAQETGEPEETRDEDLPPRFPTRLPKMTNDCMFFNTIYDWKALDPYNLVVYFNSRNTPRHIELELACFQLRFADEIAFTSRDNRLCAYGGDSIIVGHDRCPIGAINKMTVEEADALIAKYKSRRNKKKKDKAARAE